MMMTTLILAAALAAQQPGAKPSAPAPKAKAKAAATAKAQAPARPAPAGKPDASRLIARRKAKYAARYTARTNREAAEAIARQRAIEQARKEYKEALPYLLEVRRQDLLRAGTHDLADAERAKAAAIARAAGYATGAPPSPPRIMNMPGQPYAP